MGAIRFTGRAPDIAKLIKRERDRRIYAPIDCLGRTFDGDARAYAAISAKASIAADKADLPLDTPDWIATGVTSVWTDAAGDDMPITMDQMITLRNAWVAREQRLRRRAREIIADDALRAQYKEDAIWG